MPHEQPGLLLQHYATRLVNDNNMLQSAPTCSLVLIAAAAGEWAATAGSSSSSNAAAAAVDSSAAAAATAGGVPADLMDALGREFDVRMSLQLAECKCLGASFSDSGTDIYRVL
jgi:hypothetical protein